MGFKGLLSRPVRVVCLEVYKLNQTPFYGLYEGVQGLKGLFLGIFVVRVSSAFRIDASFWLRGLGALMLGVTRVFRV